MIAGGSEAAITALSYGGFCSMKAMSTNNDDFENASRPFDAERDGFAPLDLAADDVARLLNPSLHGELVAAAQRQRGL